MTFPIVHKFDAKWVVIPYEWSDFESAEIDRLVAENGGPSLAAADAIGWYVYTPLCNGAHKRRSFRSKRKHRIRY